MDCFQTSRSSISPHSLGQRIEGHEHTESQRLGGLSFCDRNERSDVISFELAAHYRDDSVLFFLSFPLKWSVPTLIQHLTVEEILKGKRPRLPLFDPTAAFKKANETSEQDGFEFE
jgi:hypothetical protein